MTQTQHVVVRPVPQYEPALETEPTNDPAAIWEQHLAAPDTVDNAEE
ncbi:hypothetical protein ACFQ9R_34665 [Nocardia sp. NPDC056541]